MGRGNGWWNEKLEGCKLNGVYPLSNRSVCPVKAMPKVVNNHSRPFHCQRHFPPLGFRTIRNDGPVRPANVTIDT